MNLKSDLPVVQVIHSMGAAGACCVRISSSVDGYTHVIMVRLLGGITSSPRLVSCNYMAALQLNVNEWHAHEIKYWLHVTTYVIERC